VFKDIDLIEGIIGIFVDVIAYQCTRQTCMMIFSCIGVLRGVDEGLYAAE
jgi:hypothetical protein